ncbi:hypothetical protein [uncultured Microscilla sp.]|uniref:hypothetical protein n=1 Tax=uncultured Microscilla sp. TaxID=432653 RepID=UPI0026343981|nr:hypothetical protein [uncultured Microscilla sp.]
MSNITDIVEDIAWLSQIWSYRWDFFECAKHEKIDDFFISHQHKKQQDFFYQPISFSIAHTDTEIITKSSEYAPEVLAKATKVYAQPGDDAFEPVVYVTDQKHLRLISTQGDWVEVQGSIHEKARGFSNIYLERSYQSFWLPIDHTNIPKNYHLDFTWQEFETDSDAWTIEQIDLVRQNLEQKDTVKYWRDFYKARNILLAEPPQHTPNGSAYAKFIDDYQLCIKDRALLILSLVNQIRPDFLLNLIVRAKKYPDLGGVTGQNFKGFLPTGETFLFLMGGRDAHQRHEMMNFLFTKSILMQEGWVNLLSALPGEPLMSGVLGFHPEQIPVLLDLQTNPELINS